ncbi:MAG: transposase [Bdellovibrionaceae bacterium]|nr:transposase [Pseudobdellovibrionaceae bacterium]
MIKGQQQKAGGAIGGEIFGDGDTVAGIKICAISDAGKYIGKLAKGNSKNVEVFKTNSITEGLHRRIDEILNRAYGMRNFNNFRIRVKAYAG